MAVRSDKRKLSIILYDTASTMLNQSAPRATNSGELSGSTMVILLDVLAVVPWPLSPGQVPCGDAVSQWSLTDCYILRDFK